MPEKFGKYLLLDRINQGGMAEVYLAKTFGFGGTDQIIALKRILTSVSEDPAFVEMFVNEAKLLVLLNHANIAQIFELDKSDDAFFIAMEYVPGRDLRAIIDRANHDGIELPEHLVLLAVAQVLEGLDFAHRKADVSGKQLNIVHRDVSPHNVLISYTGAVKLIDFGIAKMGTEATNPQGKVLRGKYGYMSPEQVLGESVDARTDVYAAGILLWEMLTQQRMFEGGSDFSVLEKVRYAEVYPPSLISPKVTPELEEVVLRALTQDRDHRYESASAMHDAVVGVMLQKYGHPKQRELANLMKSLFAREHKADLKRLEKARDYEQPPEDAAGEGATTVQRTETVVDARLPEAASTDTDPEREAFRTDEENNKSTDTDPAIFSAAVEEAARDGRTMPHIRMDGTSPGTGRVMLPEALADSSRSGSSSKSDGKSGPRGKRRRGKKGPGERRDTRVRPDRLDRQENSSRTGRSDPSRVKARPGRLEPTQTKSPEEMEAFLGNAQPTQIRDAFKPRRISRDHLIVIGAVVIALLLVLISWLATRGSTGDQTGEVRIMSVPPGAVVILDGLVVGRTPFVADGLPVGRHTVTWERPGFISETRVIEVVPNDMVPVQLVLKPVPKQPGAPPRR